LIVNGFESDIEFCSIVDNIPLIPYFADGAIKLLKDELLDSNGK
jgi:phosphosulfolactate phosphohydrolase-like enzyme